jgi:hypothetical protein
MRNHHAHLQLMRLSLLDSSPELAASDACLLLSRSVASNSIMETSSSFRCANFSSSRFPMHMKKHSGVREIPLRISPRPGTAILRDENAAIRRIPFFSFLYCFCL